MYHYSLIWTITIIVSIIVLFTESFLYPKHDVSAFHTRRHYHNRIHPPCSSSTTINLLPLPSSSYSYIQRRRRINIHPLSSSSSSSSSSSDSGTTSQQTQSQQVSKEELEITIRQLKKVLEREYLSFFNPMEREWYLDSVIFQDPLTSLTGIDSYEKNVNMLSGRTLMGNILFGNTPRDAKILLHTITGGTIHEINDIHGSYVMDDIVTRWTLQFIFKALPWKPVARFSGISQYQIKIMNHDSNNNYSKKIVQIVQQNDYWDSINLLPDGTGVSYQPVDKSIAIQHFISLLQPDMTFQAEMASSVELPFVTLRLGRKSKEKKPMVGQYEVRRYPSYIAIQVPYKRRDDAYELLGSITKGKNSEHVHWKTCMSSGWCLLIFI
jgi:Uncharacterized conserved protein (DUF2358)